MKTRVSKISPVWMTRIRCFAEVYCLTVLPLGVFMIARDGNSRWATGVAVFWNALVCFAMGRWKFHDESVETMLASSAEVVRVGNELMDKIEAHDAATAAVLERHAKAEVN